MNTLAKTSEEVLAIETYLKTLTPGTKVVYTEIQQATGVIMDASGRSKIIRAARRARIVYSVIRGTGIQLSDEITGVPILTTNLARVDNAVKRSEKVATLIFEQHGVKMSEEDRATTLGVIAMFGTIRVLADQRKRELKRLAKTKPDLAPPVVLKI